MKGHSSSGAIHRAGRLEQAWGQRWGYALRSPATSRLLPLRAAANWFSVITLAALFAIFLTLIGNPGYEFWADSQYIGFAIVFGLYLSVLGLVGLVIGTGFALFSLKAQHQGRPVASNAYKWLAIAVPYLFAAGTATVLGTPYLPALGAVLLVTGVQHACVLGVLNRQPLPQQKWSPVRRLTLSLRQAVHHEAHTRWGVLQITVVLRSPKAAPARRQESNQGGQGVADEERPSVALPGLIG